MLIIIEMRNEIDLVNELHRKCLVSEILEYKIEIDNK